MIKLKVKTIYHDEEGSIVEIKKYKTKKTNTLEHLVAINVMVEAILDNDENMNINELCKLIKENFKESKNEEK